MWLNQYYDNWGLQTELLFYANGGYTWNSTSKDNYGNYSPSFYIDGIQTIYPDTQFEIEITNNDEIEWYDAYNLLIRFGMYEFPMNQLVDPDDPLSIEPGESYAYTCTIPLDFDAREFSIHDGFNHSPNVTIRVSFPEIFTGWMQSSDAHGGMYQYDSSLNEWVHTI